MTTPEQPASPAAPAAPQPGFFTREAERLLPRAEHAEADAGRLAADVKAALQDHAGTVFDVAGDASSFCASSTPLTPRWRLPRKRSCRRCWRWRNGPQRSPPPR